MEELKRKVEKLERVEIPIEREEASADGHRPNPNRGSMIPHIETPDSEAAMPLTKTLERVLTGWRLLDADAAAAAALESGDLLVYLKAAANTGGVPEVRYCTSADAAADGEDGKNAKKGDDGRAYMFKGPLELYDINHDEKSVKFYGCESPNKRLVAEDGYGAQFKGVKHRIVDGTAGTDSAIVLSTGTYFYVKGELSGASPPRVMTYTFEKSTSGFPDGDENIEIIPCWYINVDENGIDMDSIERWLAQVNIPGIS
jgi:hypothetical protein